MTPEQAVAYVMAQVALLNAEVAGMVAENQHRMNCSQSVAFGDDQFTKVVRSYAERIGHKALDTLFTSACLAQG